MLGIYRTIYNSSDTVRQTIEDIKNKLKEDFVIVVTDNFSTDGTYEILNEYDFVEVVRAKSTKGLSRRIALKYLIKNYPEYEYGEFYGGFALYETYGRIYENIKSDLKEHKGLYKFIYLKSKSKLGEYVIIYRNRNEILDKVIEYYIEYFKE